MNANKMTQKTPPPPPPPPPPPLKPFSRRNRLPRSAGIPKSGKFTFFMRFLTIRMI